MALFEVRPYDREVYEQELKPFLPKKFIDCHAHVWLEEFHSKQEIREGSQLWPRMIAKDNSIEDLIETNRLLYPDNEVLSCIYGDPMITIDRARNNAYVAENAAKHGFAALYLSHPSQSAEELEAGVLSHSAFKGIKVYLQFAPEYIPADEIRIFDFLPHHHLEVCNRHGWIVQLHIARPKRLADPVNYVQLLEIEEKYPNVKLIVAHLGRAYANEDIGDALEVLKHTQHSMWDFTANTNEDVMRRVLETFGPDRLMYGTDFPIFRMRGRRVVENGFYINEIPQGSLGDVSADKHMREIPYPEADKITFFIYEEILSCKRACNALGLGKEDVEKIFYSNASKLFGIK